MSEAAMRQHTLGRSAGLMSRAADAGLIVWFVVGALVVVSAVGSDLFLSPRNIGNAMGQSVVLGLLAIGQTFVIVAGAIDLSVGSMVKLSTVLTAGLIDGEPGRVVPVVAGVLVLGAAVGYVNGTISTRFGVAPIITTLGTLSVLEGLAFLYTTVPVGSVPSGLGSMAYQGVGPVPYTFLLFLVVAVAASFVLRRTSFGQRIYAVGGDAQVARRAGIDPDRVTVQAMMICSTLAALGGVISAIRSGVGTPTAGEGLELAAITAVVVGGASLFGGRGRLLGSIGGAVLITLIDNSLNLLGVSTFSKELVRGMVIVAAVAIFVRKD